MNMDDSEKPYSEATVRNLIEKKFKQRSFPIHYKDIIIEALFNKVISLRNVLKRINKIMKESEINNRCDDNCKCYGCENQRLAMEEIMASIAWSIKEEQGRHHWK